MGGGNGLGDRLGLRVGIRGRVGVYRISGIINIGSSRIIVAGIKHENFNF